MPLTVETSSTALVLIDLQNGIAEGQLFPRQPAQVIANARKLLDGFRAFGGTVVLVHVMFPGNPSGLQPIADVDMNLPPREPAGWSDLVHDLDVHDSDIIVLKRNWGAFYGTDLDLHLRRRGIKTIVLGGIATSIGVESTARDAFERGYQQIIVEDACADRKDEGHKNSISLILPRIARIRSTAEVLAALKS